MSPGPFRSSSFISLRQTPIPAFSLRIGNSAEVTFTTSGGLGEAEVGGPTMNIVPKQGGNTFSGLAFVSGYSKGMLADNFDDDLRAQGVTVPAPVYRVYDFNIAAGGPIVRDKLWYYMSVRQQGSRQNTLNTFYNKNAGNPNSFLYEPDLSRPAYSDRTWENYTPRITWQIPSRKKVTG